MFERGEGVMRLAFGILPTWKVVAMMPMSYPADSARPSNWHFHRKDTEELHRFI